MLRTHSFGLMTLNLLCSSPCWWRLILALLQPPRSKRSSISRTILYYSCVDRVYYCISIEFIILEIQCGDKLKPHKFTNKSQPAGELAVNWYLIFSFVYIYSTSCTLIKLGFSFDYPGSLVRGGWLEI